MQVAGEFSARARRAHPQTNGEPYHAHFVSWRTFIRARSRRFAAVTTDLPPCRRACRVPQSVAFPVRHANWERNNRSVPNCVVPPWYSSSQHGWTRILPYRNGFRVTMHGDKTFHQRSGKRSSPARRIQIIQGGSARSSNALCPTDHGAHPDRGDGGRQAWSCARARRSLSELTLARKRDSGSTICWASEASIRARIERAPAATRPSIRSARSVRYTAAR